MLRGKLAFGSLSSIVLVALCVAPTMSLADVVKHDAPLVVDAEQQALEDFYTATGGPRWLKSDNWLKGDPCTNQWLGVYCRNSLVAYVRRWRCWRCSVMLTVGCTVKDAAWTVRPRRCVASQPHHH